MEIPESDHEEAAYEAVPRGFNTETSRADCGGAVAMTYRPSRWFWAVDCRTISEDCKRIGDDAGWPLIASISREAPSKPISSTGWAAVVNWGLIK